MFFFYDPADPEFYPYGHTLSLHAALPSSAHKGVGHPAADLRDFPHKAAPGHRDWPHTPPALPTLEMHRMPAEHLVAASRSLHWRAPEIDRKSTRLNSSH